MAVPEEISDPDIYSDIPEGRFGSPQKEHSPFIGFAAGICSGLQCAPPGTFNGAWDCFKKTVSKEGPRALYKGASIPAISWGITDSILMGSSLHNYRAFLSAHGLGEQVPNSDQKRLSLLGHSVAGLFAGWTNATVAHPTEIIKCKLQLQLVQPEHVPRQFSGPIDVVRQTVAEQGVTGMWRGLGASFIYRSCFAAMFGSFEVFNRLFKSWDGTNWAMSAGLANFLAGGMASNAYWLTALPLDNVKNRIMSGGPSSSHHPLLTQYLFIADDIKTPRYRSVFDAYRQVWNEAYDGSKGLRWNVLARTKNFYRGFVPVALRAFPTNAAALAVWEGVMRWSKA
ncbi:hypothetical protein CNBK1730 [Cryptococcus deneoformans B-3501A]|uniref:hypothetical protein n=1 Tax=Cryptococcus deneoformans (strain B-3501A) TaxID=283643 RepID=UPI0000430335|nr:hypothetical protein CNBK1730 [Cryptococcus neoformans var. neoformans B-3501A]EAL18152.1 hypothetical protein CNBK1730 [Cryptococcus neoformans var. neoformans B-3501A]